MARYRSGLQGALSSLEDGMEDSTLLWRFDMGGTEELENYFIFSDWHRGMRMDIDGVASLGRAISFLTLGRANWYCKHQPLKRCIIQVLKQESLHAHNFKLS